MYKKGGLSTASRLIFYSVFTSNPNSSGRNLGQTFSREAMTEAASLVPILQDSPIVFP